MAKLQPRRMIDHHGGHTALATEKRGTVAAALFLLFVVGCLFCGIIPAIIKSTAGHCRQRQNVKSKYEGNESDAVKLNPFCLLT